jgi:hypothetical protein
MRIARSLASWMFAATMIVLLGWLSVSPTRVEAQQGDNAVCNSSSPPTGIKCSPAVIDASVITGSPSNDLCGKIFTIMNATAYTGAVIDARGVTALSCAIGVSPWTNGTVVVSKPSRILLPAGTISITVPWVLPKNTRITGEGRANTTISPSYSTGSIITMGDATCIFNNSCFNISIEDLTLNGNNSAVDGIDNNAAQELSYVNNVSLTQIEGTGLSIMSGTLSPANSGPYSNIYFTAGSSAGSSTACARISQVNTRGIHGITCSAANGTTPLAAIYLDGNSNTIEDFHVEGFQDGILVGDSEPTESNVLVNINGANGAGPVNNVIHISGNNPSSDLAILGVRSSGAYYTIQDDLTTTTLADAAVAIYTLGEPVGSITGAYSRFTTSPSAQTWGAGNGVPSGPCAIGSLYSNKAASNSNNTLYICIPIGGTGTVWTALTVP